MAAGPIDWGLCAAEALRAGDWGAGAAHLRRAVALAPTDINVLGNWAACRQQQGGLDAAAQWLHRALAFDDRDGEALIALAMVAPDVAIRRRSCRRAAALGPGLPEAWLRAGAAVIDLDPADSLSGFRRALVLAPGEAPALVGSGLALGRLGRWREAYAAYRRGLVFAPDRVDAWDGLADPASGESIAGDQLRAARRAVAVDGLRAAGWHRLGACLWHGRRPAEAAHSYRRALSLVPELVETMANLGAASRELGKAEEALHWFSRAVVLAPDSAGAMTNLGTAMPPGDAGAIRWHRRALVQDGAHPHALNNLGSQHLARNELPAALRWFERAIAAGYPDGEARWNRGVTKLVAGDLAGGFADYEHRWSLRAFAGWRRAADRPPWVREPGAGRSVLVYAEQGIGDTIQFARYLPALARLGWHVVLESQPALSRLLRSLDGPSEVVAKGAPLPAVDAQVPLLSLPAAFGTTLETIPAPKSYLSAPSADWPELRAARGRRLGLVWAGNPEHKNDANRSLSEAAVSRLLAGIGDRPDLSLFSLQVGPRRSDLATPGLVGHRIVDLAPRLTDFAETAAAIAALDLVIAVDTSVIHLAGALGRPGWLLLPFSPDWRWLLERNDSPWYPSLRLYRQSVPGNWTGPIDAVLDDLGTSSG